MNYFSTGVAKKPFLWKSIATDFAIIHSAAQDVDSLWISAQSNLMLPTHYLKGNSQDRNVNLCQTSNKYI
jgi:hypothetical protein